VSAPTEAARREVADAIMVCAECRVREECLELALRNWAVGQHGVWGGTVPVPVEAMMVEAKKRDVRLDSSGHRRGRRSGRRPRPLTSPSIFP
jgi:hypothetical protein